jgi:FkbM family methyltransferase
LSATSKVIYDFGANNGDDISYYFLKAERVVAVEANPILCEQIRSRFAAEIGAGRLVVENCVVSAGIASDRVPFYVHRSNHVLSQFLQPDDAAEFDEIHLRARPASEIVRTHGEPLYIKIDVEGYDQQILRDLFENCIRPPYISAESYDIEVFAQLVVAGYAAFKLTDGFSVWKLYNDHPVRSLDGSLRKYSFPFQSAGPFGEDLKGQWMTANTFFKYLAFEGLGWKDIHASNVDVPKAILLVGMRPYIERTLRTLVSKVSSVFSGLISGRTRGLIPHRSSKRTSKNPRAH